WFCAGWVATAPPNCSSLPTLAVPGRGASVAAATYPIGSDAPILGSPDIHAAKASARFASANRLRVRFGSSSPASAAGPRYGFGVGQGGEGEAGVVVRGFAGQASFRGLAGVSPPDGGSRRFGESVACWIPCGGRNHGGAPAAGAEATPGAPVGADAAGN